MQKKFVEKHEDEIKKFGMYKRLDDSLQFMIDHTHLACEFTANYLVIWCIDLEEEGVSHERNIKILRGGGGDTPPNYDSKIVVEKNFHKEFRKIVHRLGDV